MPVGRMVLSAGIVGSRNGRIWVKDVLFGQFLFFFSLVSLAFADPMHGKTVFAYFVILKLLNAIRDLGCGHVSPISSGHGI